MSQLQAEVLQALASGEPRTRSEIFEVCQSAEEIQQISRVLWKLKQSGEVVHNNLTGQYTLGDGVTVPERAPVDPPTPPVADDLVSDSQTPPQQVSEPTPAPIASKAPCRIREATRRIDQAIETYLTGLNDPQLDALLAARAALRDLEAA